MTLDLSLVLKKVRKKKEQTNAWMVGNVAPTLLKLGHLEMPKPLI